MVNNIFPMLTRLLHPQELKIMFQNPKTSSKEGGLGRRELFLEKFQMKYCRLFDSYIHKSIKQTILPSALEAATIILSVLSVSF